MTLDSILASWAGGALLLATLAAPVSAGTVDILTSRGDTDRTGANLRETLLTTSNVNKASFQFLFDYDLSSDDGQPGGEVYAQPLVATHVGIPRKGTRNVVIVATTANLVFAFDADGKANPEQGVLWKRSLGKPPAIDDMLKGALCLGVPDGLGETFRTEHVGDFRTCDNIASGVKVGIMSTPVIDRRRSVIFVVARTIDASGNVHQKLHALDLNSGDDRVGSPVELGGSASGVSFAPNIQNQRVGLALAKDQVIVAFGSHEDQQAYRGWVMSYRFGELGFTQTGIFVTTPTGSTDGFCWMTLNNCAHGGIWQTGRAPVVDADGRVVLFVGNGKNDLRAGLDNADFGNSVVALDPVTLAVKDFYTPANHSIPGPTLTVALPGLPPLEFQTGTGINELDLDLGGSGPMVIPGSSFVVGGGKEGVMHVWRLDSLGRFSASDAGVVQKFAAGDIHLGLDVAGEDSTFALVVDAHAGHIMGGPVFWARPASAGGSRLFNWSEDAELRSFPVDPTASRPIDASSPRKGSPIQGGHPGGVLTLSAHGSARASGIVWAATYNAQGDPKGALHHTRPGILRAYAADDLRELWTSEQEASRDRLGTLAKFVPPTVADGRVYMATFSNRLVVYGLVKHPYPKPAAEVFSQSVLPLLDDPVLDP